jgi:hypothetical protein
VFHDSQLKPEDWSVFAEYGRTMLAMQEFESTLTGAVDLDWPDFTNMSTQEERSEALHKALDKLFRMSAGQLKARLKKKHAVPENLLAEITGILRIRNRLAHSSLRDYISNSINNPSHSTASIEELKNIRQRVEEVDRQLLAWSQEQVARERRERAEHLLGASPEERRNAAQELYNDGLQQWEWGRRWFIYDYDHNLFRFPDGRFAFSREEADWLLLAERGGIAF